MCTLWYAETIGPPNRPYSPLNSTRYLYIWSVVLLNVQDRLTMMLPLSPLNKSIIFSLRNYRNQCIPSFRQLDKRICGAKLPPLIPPKWKSHHLISWVFFFTSKGEDWRSQRQQISREHGCMKLQRPCDKFVTRMFSSLWLIWWWALVLLKSPLPLLKVQS